MPFGYGQGSHVSGEKQSPVAVGLMHGAGSKGYQISSYIKLPLMFNWNWINAFLIENFSIRVLNKFASLSSALTDVLTDNQK